MVAEPFGALYLLRRQYFSQQSRALYRRYAHVLTILLTFFGLMLVERPGLLAAPILHFWREPANWQASLAYAGGWLLVIALWARVHQTFVRGAALAGFARTSVHGQRVAPALDFALLLVALRWCTLPLFVAVWTVATSGAPPVGADGRFPFYLAVVLLLTIALARAVVFGAGRARGLRLGAALMLLVLAGASGPLAASGSLLAAVALLLFDLVQPGVAPAAGCRHARATGMLRGPGLWFLMLLHLRALWRGHQHVALPRIGLVLALQAACWWMICRVGKHQDGPGFIAVACCVSACALSGLYYAFWRARQPIEPYLRSLPFGVARTLMAEHVVVLGAASGIYGLVWLGYRWLPVDGAVAPDLLSVLARSAGVSLLLLAVLGTPILQRHRHGVAFKLALTVGGLFLMQGMQ